MGTKGKILIIEDEEAISKALADALTTQGFEVIMAKNGEEGLKTALTVRPGLILLDILMPKMNGLAMMDKLRADAWGKTVPIIILTNVSPDSNSVLNSVAANQPAFYLVKSEVTLEGIIEKVREVLK